MYYISSDQLCMYPFTIALWPGHPDSLFENWPNNDMQYFGVSKQWCGWQCWGFSRCTKMSMSATAHGGCVDIIRGSCALKAGTRTKTPRCTESWYWDNNPSLHWKLVLGQQPLAALKAGTRTTTPRCAEVWNLRQQHTRPGARASELHPRPISCLNPSLQPRFLFPSPHSKSCRCALVKDPIAAALAKVCIYCPNTGNELTGWDGVDVAANMTVRYCPTPSSGKRSKNAMKHVYKIQQTKTESHNQQGHRQLMHSQWLLVALWVKISLKAHISSSAIIKNQHHSNNINTHKYILISPLPTNPHRHSPTTTITTQKTLWFSAALFTKTRKYTSLNP